MRVAGASSAASLLGVSEAVIGLDGEPRTPALFQILLTTGMTDILQGLQTVFLEPGGQTPGHLSETKHPVLVLLSRRLTPGFLPHYQYGPVPVSGISLLLGNMGAQLIALANADKPFQVTGMQKKGGPPVFIPADIVRQLAAHIQGNPQWMAYIHSWNRTVGAVRAALVRRRAAFAKKDQGGSSGSGGGGGWSSTFGQGGRRKRTRKHKKKKKRTRRRKHRYKRTRHRRRKKRHTRKH